MTDRPANRIHRPSTGWDDTDETRRAHHHAETPTSMIYENVPRAAAHADPLAWSQDRQENLYTQYAESADYYADSTSENDRPGSWIRSTPTFLMVAAVVAVLCAGGGLLYTLTGSSHQNRAPAQPQTAQPVVEPTPAPEAPAPVPEQSEPPVPDAPTPAEPAYSGPADSAPDAGAASAPAADQPVVDQPVEAPPVIASQQQAPQQNAPPPQAPQQQQAPQQNDPDQQQAAPQRGPGAIAQPPINQQQPGSKQNGNQKTGGKQNLPSDPADASPDKHPHPGQPGNQQPESPNDTLCHPKAPPC